MDVIDKFDDIIIGSGGAGLTTAIFLARSSRKVAIISKSLPYLSHTGAAQGGINANYGNQLKDDWKWHAYDTIRGSDWLADQDAVEILCQNANSAVDFLSEIGVEFDKDSHNKILQKKYGGQTTEYGKGELAKRACSVGDRTGAAMLESLYKEAIKLGVIFINYNLVIDLLFQDNKCNGLISYDIPNGDIKIFNAKNIIVATGGFSCIYEENTASNTLTGDGLYLISKNNYALKDMEFIQFHPTSMKGTGILISETARSIGGYLINDSEERFMFKDAPKYAELAPRDIVSRSISKELEDPNKNTYLDLRHVSLKQIYSKLNYVAKACNYFIQKDISKELIPVRPAAHYTMGGIPTNNNCQVIDILNDKIIDGLYSVGEAACVSVHGANRLGCNSLLDIVVFGIECAKHIISKPYKEKNTKLNYDHLNNIFSNNIETTIRFNQSDIKRISTKFLGINRSEINLLKAINLLDEIRPSYKLQKPNSAWDIKFINEFEYRSLHELALHVAFAGLSRKESRGSHFREDYQTRCDEIFLKHTYSYKINDKFDIKYGNVRTKTKNLDYFKPEIRNY